MSSRGKRFDSFNPPKVKAWRPKLYLISVHKDKEAGGACGGSKDRLVPSLNGVFQGEKNGKQKHAPIWPLEFKLKARSNAASSPSQTVGGQKPIVWGGGAFAF